MFIERARGLTLRRIEESLYTPHPASERFDPDFPTAMRCADCGRLGYGPRKHMEEAIDEHRKVCPARVSHDQTQPFVTRIFYPVD